MKFLKDNILVIASITIIAIFVIGLGTNWFGINSPKQSYNLTINDSPVLGNPNASITIYEFSDFSCPFCAAADGKNDYYIELLKKNNPDWTAPIPLVIQNYVNTGKAKIIFKYFPGHGQGKPAHEIAWCLNDQNLFWQFHEQAFANQEKLSDYNAMKDIASKLGANMNELNSCISSGKYNYKFAQDTNEAKSIGIQGTPTFIINGKELVGAQSYSEFEKVIEDELSN
jgi:protein-disulfide isomerase